MVYMNSILLKLSQLLGIQEVTHTKEEHLQTLFKEPYENLWYQHDSVIIQLDEWHGPWPSPSQNLARHGDGAPPPLGFRHDPSALALPSCVVDATCDSPNVLMTSIKFTQHWSLHNKPPSKKRYCRTFVPVIAFYVSDVLVCGQLWPPFFISVYKSLSSTPFLSQSSAGRVAPQNRRF